MRRLPPAPGGGLQRLGGRRRGGGQRRGGGAGQQCGEAHGRGGGAGVGDGPLVAVAPLEGPGAALHLAQAADGVEDDRGPVDGHLGVLRVGGHLSVQAGPDPVLQVGGEGPRLENKRKAHIN